MADTQKPSTVAGDRLKSFVERVEKLLEERKAIQSDIKDVFSEAKGVGYDVRTMRRLISLRAQDSADRAEQEALLDTYMSALGMNSYGASREPTEEELEERAARIVAQVDRCLALAEDGHPPKIAAIQAELGCSLGKASKIRKMVEERISRSAPDMRENETTTSSGGGNSRSHKGGSQSSASTAPDLASDDEGPSIAGVATGPLDTAATKTLTVTMMVGDASSDAPLLVPLPLRPLDTRTFDEIVGPIPDHLRRTA